MLKTQDVIIAMTDNMYVQMTYFARQLSGHEVFDLSDMTIVTSPLANNTFNCVLQARLLADNVDQRIEEVKQFYEQRAVPFAWWVGTLDMPRDLPVLLTQHGFEHDEQELGMVLPLAVYEPVSSGPLIIERVLDRSTLSLFDRVHVICGFTQDAFEKRFGLLNPVCYGEGSSIELYIGCIGDEVAVTGMLVLHAGVAGIYYIATVPDQRRKGYGTAMMHSLLTRAKMQGYAYAVLQASAMGAPVYKRLGFECIGIFDVFCYPKTVNAA